MYFNGEKYDFVKVEVGGGGGRENWEYRLVN